MADSTDFLDAYKRPIEDGAWYECHQVYPDKPTDPSITFVQASILPSGHPVFKDHQTNHRTDITPSNDSLSKREFLNLHRVHEATIKAYIIGLRRQAEWYEKRLAEKSQSQPDFRQNPNLPEFGMRD